MIDDLGDAAFIEHDFQPRILVSAAQAAHRSGCQLFALEPAFVLDFDHERVIQALKLVIREFARVFRRDIAAPKWCKPLDLLREDAASSREA